MGTAVHHGNVVLHHVWPVEIAAAVDEHALAALIQVNQVVAPLIGCENSRASEQSIVPLNELLRKIFGIEAGGPGSRRSEPRHRHNRHAGPYRESGTTSGKRGSLKIQRFR